MMSMGLMFYEKSPFVYFRWPLTFTFDLWPSAFVKVTCTFFIRCILCCWMFVPKRKFVSSVEFEILTIEWRKFKWRHHDIIPHLIFYEIFIQICKGHIKSAYQIPDWSNIRELRYTEGKLIKNYEEKKDFEPLWPWPLTQGHNFNWVWASVLSSRLAPRPNRCICSAGILFTAESDTQTHRQTHRQTVVKI